MNRQMALRILWKEYRTQRSMWLFLFATCFAIQVIVALSVEVAADSLDNQLIIGTLFAFFFVVASSSTTFSSESEDGTQIRLLSFGVSPSWTLSLKLAHLGAAACLMLAIVAVAASAFSGESAWTSRPFRSSIIMQPPIHFQFDEELALCFLGTASVGVVCSLMLTRSLAAVACSALSVYGIRTILNEIKHALGLNISQALFMGYTILCFIVVLDYWLMARWFRNSKQPHSFSEFAKGSVRLLLSFGSRRERANDRIIETLSEIAGSDAIDQLAPSRSLRRLHAVSGQAPSRAFRFLRWKEVTETRRYFLWVAAAYLFFAVLMPFIDPTGTTWAHVAAFFYFVGAVALGLCTFRGEQRGGAYRFLTHRGIAPSMVWLSKLSVWLPRLAISSLLIFTIVVVLAEPSSFVSITYRSGLKHCFITYCGVAGVTHDWQLRGDISVYQVGRIATNTLLLFAIGQVASLCFTRALVSLFVGLLAGSVALFWIWLTSQYGVPLYFSTLPIVPLLFAVSWTRSRDWLLDKNTFASWKLPSTLAAVGVVVCLGLSIWHRAYEIPASEPLYWEQLKKTNGLTAEQTTNLFRDVTPEEKATADLILFADQNVNIERPSEVIDWRQFRPEWHVQLQEQEPVLRRLIDAANREVCAFDSVASRTQANEPRLSNAKELVNLMILSAAALQHEGQHAESLTRLEQTLRLCRHFEGRGSLRAYEEGTELTKLVCAAFQQLSAFKDMEPALRGRADTALEQFLANSVNFFVICAAEHRAFRNSVSESIADRDRSQGTSGRIWSLLSYRLPSEEIRRERLLNYLENDDAHRVWRLDSGLRDWHSTYEDQSRNGVVATWKAKTPIMDKVVSPNFRFVRAPIIDRRTHVGATRLILKIHDQQFQTGIMPASIGEYGFGTGLSRDWWTLRCLVWKPDGIPNSIESEGDLVIPANRPFLMSVGPNHCFLSDVENRPVAPGAEEAKVDVSDGTPAPTFAIEFRSPVYRPIVFLVPTLE